MGCPNPAAWVYWGTGTGDHLCDEHKSQREEGFVELYGEVPDPIGLEGIDRFLPVEHAGGCEWLVRDTQSFCGEEAAWVELATVEVHLCEGHKERDVEDR